MKKENYNKKKKFLTNLINTTYCMRLGNITGNDMIDFSIYTEDDIKTISYSYNGRLILYETCDNFIKMMKTPDEFCRDIVDIIYNQVKEDELEIQKIIKEFNIPRFIIGKVKKPTKEEILEYKKIMKQTLFDFLLKK